MLDVKKNLCLLTAFLLFGLMSTFAREARAVDWQEYNITETDKAIYAFYSVKKQQPDFDFWIKTNPDYINMSNAQKERFLIDEMLRLGQGHSYFDNSVETLNINAPIMVKYSSVTEESGEKPKLEFQFFGEKEHYIPAFDFPFGRDTIAVIVNKLGFFSDLKLSEGQDTLIRPKIPKEDTLFNANLELRIRPTHINNSRTERKKEGGTRWVMVSEIAYIKCEVKSTDNDERILLWDYVAPWYKQQFDALNAAKIENIAPHPYDIHKK